MDNFSPENNEQNQNDMIDELIQAHTNNIAKQEAESTETQLPAPVEATPVPQAEEKLVPPDDIENITELVKKADEEANLPPKTTKKFVISINNEYIDYFDELSNEDRAELVNSYLKKDIDTKDKQRLKKKILLILKHILIVLLTVVIGFPVIFKLVNTSIQSTLKSYKYMQVNFEKLYQEKNINRLD